jgi:hypothetical protein
MFTRKGKSIALLSLCCILFAVPVKANTVSFYLQDIGELEISGFQLFFAEPNFPVDYDWDAFTSDFEYNWGADQSPNKQGGWELVSLFRSEGNIDYAVGIGATALTLSNTELKLEEGLVLTMSSQNTDFVMDIENLSNVFFDFALPNGEPIELILTESWVNGDQTVIASAVPIPSSMLLLGGGLIGFIVSRRKRKR